MTTFHTILMVRMHEREKHTLRLSFSCLCLALALGLASPNVSHFPPLECFENEARGKILALNYTGEPELKIVWSNASQSIDQRPQWFFSARKRNKIKTGFDSKVRLAFCSFSVPSFRSCLASYYFIFVGGFFFEDVVFYDFSKSFFFFMASDFFVSVSWILCSSQRPVQTPSLFPFL